VVLSGLVVLKEILHNLPQKMRLVFWCWCGRPTTRQKTLNAMSNERTAFSPRPRCNKSEYVRSWNRSGTSFPVTKKCVRSAESETRLMSEQNSSLPLKGLTGCQREFCYRLVVRYGVFASAQRRFDYIRTLLEECYHLLIESLRDPPCRRTFQASGEAGR
jgi:hypothetical protein